MRTQRKVRFNVPSTKRLRIFDSLVSSIVHIHHQTQDFKTKAVNVALTLRNWLIGYCIVEFEQQGKNRAVYGERLLPALAERLSAAGLKRVDVREFCRFRLLYGVYPEIRETVTPELLADLGVGALQPHLNSLPQPKRETVSPESENCGVTDSTIAQPSLLLPLGRVVGPSR